MNDDKGQNVNQSKKAPLAFYIIQWTIPFILLGIVELGLRGFGYGTSYEPFIKIDGNNPEMLYVNPEMTNKYFGNLESSVFSSRIGFLEKKPENSFRVFVLGGSSAQGFPYARNASFPSQLKRRLDYIYPDQTIEVINLGASAVNTHTLLDLLPSVLEQSPDLILIYAGHNEYYGALGPGSSRFSNPSLTRMYLGLKDFRLVQFFENLLKRSPDTAGEESENLMQDMIGESSIEYRSEIYQAGIDQFDNNMSDILIKIKNADVPVIIGTLSSNLLTQKPFNSSYKDDSGKDANAYYTLGLEKIKAGNYAEAKESLIKAKELDGLRFRAPEKISQLIREKAGEMDLPLVDIEKIFNNNSPMGITGDDLMCDHLHPNRRGYFLMSKSYFQEMQDNNLIPTSEQIGSYNEQTIDSILLAESPYTRFDSLVDRRLLLSGLGSYPFVPRGTPNPYADIINNDGLGFEIESLSQTDSIRRIVAAEHLMKNDTLSFRKEMKVFMSYFPVEEKPYASAINYLSEKSLLGTAYPFIFLELNEQKNSNSKSKMIGRYYSFMQNYDTALMYLEPVVNNVPDDPYLLLDVGYIHLTTQNYSRAVEVYSKVIELLPDNTEAYHQRAVAQFELRNYQNTIDDMSRVINLSEQPTALNYLIRGYAKLGLKDQSEACKDWTIAVGLGSKESEDLLQEFCQ